MFLGVDIGGTKCAVTLGDKDGNIILKERFLTTDVNETISNIISAAKKLSQNQSVLSCGISCGGPLNEKEGIIMSPPNLLGWDNIHIKEILEKELGIPCSLRNDANACAMAEWYFGAGKGTENMIFMTFGTGLGAGLILNGKLYSGTNGNAGEVGHIRLGDFGPSGFGKCGSFEGFCSGNGIKELGRALAREAIQRGETVLWAEHGIDNIEVVDIANAARKGDEIALKVFNLSATKLGEGLSILIDILNPEKIIIGSVFARCHDLFAPIIEKIINKEALGISANVCEVVPAELGEKIGDMAALAVAKEVYDELHN
jgi:glucokinase